MRRLLGNIDSLNLTQISNYFVPYNHSAPQLVGGDLLFSVVTDHVLCSSHITHRWGCHMPPEETSKNRPRATAERRAEARLTSGTPSELQHSCRICHWGLNEANRQAAYLLQPSPHDLNRLYEWVICFLSAAPAHEQECFGRFSKERLFFSFFFFCKACKANTREKEGSHLQAAYPPTSSQSRNLPGRTF